MTATELRTLYAPIFEGGSVHATAVRYKRGLYNALAAFGPVCEFDYLANDPATVYQGFVNRIYQFQPTLMLTQFHGANILSPDEIRSLRALKPDMKWLNWSGDSWSHGLTGAPILAMTREVDMQLVAAPDVLPVYEREGIRAAYWNIAYEPPVEPLPDMPSYDVVWLANVINDKRRVLMERLKALDGVSVGIYGDWERADGNNVYNFPAGEALYKNARLAICDNVYPDQQNYVSNRPMQAMAAGGAMVLHQRVPKMEALTRWRDGFHYMEWLDADDLVRKIRLYLTDAYEPGRKGVAKTAQRQVMQYHTWDARVKQLVDEFLPSIEKVTVS